MKLRTNDLYKHEARLVQPENETEVVRGAHSRIV